MKTDVESKDLSFDSICRVSEDIVVREIEGEVIIIPLTSDIGDSGDELYSLNGVGHTIWDKFDGIISLGEILDVIQQDFEGNADQIKEDIIGFTKELIRMKLVILVRE
jgi:hypothetical protein